MNDKIMNWVKKNRPELLTSKVPNDFIGLAHWVNENIARLDGNRVNGFELTEWLGLLDWAYAQADAVRA